MALDLVVFLVLIFIEVAWPGWACGWGGCPRIAMGGNPFLVASVLVAVAVAIHLAITESRIDRRGLREVVDDERRTLIKLKGWRNAYFGAIVGLFLFSVLSDTSSAVDTPFLLGAVMVSGALALFWTLVILDRE